MEEIIKKCKCSVTLNVNDYRDCYQTIKEAIEEENRNEPIIEPELAERMIKENMFISLQFYPDTPIGFYKVYGTTFKEVVDKALLILK